MTPEELPQWEAKAAEVRRELAQRTVRDMGLTPAGHLAHAIAHIEAAQNQAAGDPS